CHPNAENSAVIGDTRHDDRIGTVGGGVDPRPASKPLESEWRSAIDSDAEGGGIALLNGLAHRLGSDGGWTRRSGNSPFAGEKDRCQQGKERQFTGLVFHNFEEKAIKNSRSKSHLEAQPSGIMLKLLCRFW